MRILVVEDEHDLAGAVAAGLRREGYAVDVAGDGRSALDRLGVHAYDMVCLDLNLPDADGLDICRHVVTAPRPGDGTADAPRILVLSARDRVEDRIVGLDHGADDYLVKPFSLEELAARVRAVLRRRQSFAAKGSVYRGERLVADFDAVAVSVDGEAIRLTRREFELLRFLVENKNRVLSRDRLLERVWGYDRFIETRSVDVHVGRLRAKLGTVGTQIETVVGLGYRFVD